jgi:hypothetical protein
MEGQAAKIPHRVRLPGGNMNVRRLAPAGSSSGAWTSANPEPL